MTRHHHIVRVLTLCGFLIACDRSADIAYGAPAPGHDKSTKAGVGPAQWQLWQDPKEKAFSLYVPKGWKVKGGLLRPSPIGTAATLELTSPDGQITVICTDDFPAYHELSDAAVRLGYRIGSKYKDEWGVPREIQNYAPGEKFLTGFLLPTRGQVKVIGERKVEAASRKPFEGLELTWNCGEVDYRVKRTGDDKERHGAALAVTWTMTGVVRQWAVVNAYVYEAPPERMEEAKRVLLRAIMTTRIRQEWLEAEMKGVQARIDIATQTQSALGDLARQSYFDWQDSRSKMMKRTTDVLTDQLDVYDPESGTIHAGVDNKFKTYWLNRAGKVVGSNGHDRPDIDHRPLVILP